MTTQGNILGDQEAGGLSDLNHTCEEKSRGRIYLKTRFAGELIHADTLDPRNATARTKFVSALIKKLKAKFGLSAAPEEIDQELLQVLEEVDEASEANETPLTEYSVVEGSDDPERDGIYRQTPRGPEQISNFGLTVVVDHLVKDGGQARRIYQCRVSIGGKTTEFDISAEDFSVGPKLLAAVHRAAGPKVSLSSRRPDDLCRAVSALSDPDYRESTTDFGWTKEGDAFLTPSVRIDAGGVHTIVDDESIRVKLDDEEYARHLDLVALEPEELGAIKTHVVADLLQLHVRRVTYLLLAATALAVLTRFAPGMNRPAIWLTGLTGSGKSFLARLFAGFFGDFPVAEGHRTGSWSSTPYSLQRQGHFFKDATFLIDDYKPDVVHHKQAITLLQNYADGSARGRLNSDSTSKVSRPIRGLLISTGEDVPEHSSSAAARSVVVSVPQVEKDIARGQHCRDRSGRYRGLMADFIHHLIAGGRTAGFADRVQAEFASFHEGIEGQQNAPRIAGNLALLMAAFSEFAEYMGSAWPARLAAVEVFRAELVALRDRMLTSVQDQQPSEIFLATLGALVVNGQVQITGWSPGHSHHLNVEGKPVVGRLVVPTNPGQTARFEISTKLALAAGQDLLRRQSKPPLAITEKALIRQMASDGKLLDRDDQPYAPEGGGDHTWAAKLEGETRNVFRIRVDTLLGEPEVAITEPVDVPGVGGSNTVHGEQP